MTVYRGGIVDDAILNASKARIERLEKRNKISEIILYAGLAFIVGSMIFLWFLINRRVNQLNELVISVDHVTPIHTIDLCPGEAVSYRYTLHSNTNGVIEVDAAIWRVEPPQTVIYSLPGRMILDGPTDITVTEDWNIPLAPITRQVSDMSPGKYERRLAFRNLYQTETPAQLKIPFTIREGCPTQSGQGGP